MFFKFCHKPDKEFGISELHLQKNYPHHPDSDT